MTAALLIVWLSGADVGTPWAQAMEQALRRSLRAEVMLQVLSSERSFTGRADAVVLEASWLATPQPTAVLKFIHPHGQPARVLKFRSVDSADERGRTVGLALSSMVPQWKKPPAPEPAPLETPLLPVPPAVSPEVAEFPAVVATQEPAQRWWAELVLQGQSWTAQPDVGLGGALAVAHQGEDVSVQLAVQGAWVPLPRFEGAAWELGVNLSLGRTAWRGAWVSLTPRGGVGLFYRAASRAGQTLTRWVPWGEASLDVEAKLNPRWSLVLHPGVALTGRTSLYVGDENIAVLSPWRLTLGLGLRGRFGL